VLATTTASVQGAWPTYYVYGVALASDFPFTSHLATVASRPNLSFTCAGKSPVSWSLPPTEPIYASRFRTARGESNCCFYRLGELDLLRFPDVGDFFFAGDRIVFCSAELMDRAAIEIHLLGTVLSCWLERDGVPALHASVVVADGRAVGFLSHNGGGKSSLAAAMMQGGHPLLTDSVLAVKLSSQGFSGQHGYPQMRLWPAEAGYFCGSANFPRVYRDVSKVCVPVGRESFGAFDETERPLIGFYLPARRPPGDGNLAVEIQMLSRRDAVIEFVRHSFVAPLVEAAGWQARRLDFFARLAAEVPVKRLIYPSGLEHLPRVRDAILADLENR
jgi:hypothetical protein